MNSRIATLRSRLGWTQVQMAQFLGVDQSTVSRMERTGVVSKPVEKLLEITSAMTVCPDTHGVTQINILVPEKLTIAAANPLPGSDGDGPVCADTAGSSHPLPACSPVGTRHRLTLDPVASAVASPRQQDT